MPPTLTLKRPELPAMLRDPGYAVVTLVLFAYLLFAYESLLISNRESTLFKEVASDRPIFSSMPFANRFVSTAA